MIEALRSVRYGRSNLALAEAWDSQLLGVQPYRTDSVLRYCVDGTWLELVELQSAATPAGVLVHWAVDSLTSELLRLHALGITPQMPPAVLGAGGTQTAAFLDPFGHAVGLVEIHDPGVQRSRDHRAAEKIALRNVRATLDDLGAEGRQQRKATMLVLSLVVLVVLGLFAGGVMFRKLLPSKPPPDERIIVQLSGRK